jgi:hypothetical protein
LAGIVFYLAPIPRPGQENIMTARRLFAATLTTLLVACGSTSTPSGTAKMNVRLVDAPSSGYDEVNVDVQTVEATPTRS